MANLGKIPVEPHIGLQLCLIVIEVRLKVVPHVTKPGESVRIFCNNTFPIIS